MTLIPVLCPHCKSDKVGKNGYHPNGKQRYICKNSDCPHKTFVLEYTYKANDPKVKEKIFEHAVNGTGTRATSRLLGIAKDTVTNVLKKSKVKFPK